MITENQIISELQKWNASSLFHLIKNLPMPLSDKDYIYLSFISYDGCELTVWEKSLEDIWKRFELFRNNLSIN
jgi:hypothetical protein